MTATCPFEELLAARVLDALDEAERAELERHLAAGCPVCGPELEEMERVAEAIALSVPAVQPREAVRRELLERAAAVVPFGGPARRGSAPRRGWALAAAVVLLLLGGSIAWGVRLQQRLQRSEQARAALAADLAAARARLGRDEVERTALLRHLAVLGASRLQQVELSGQPPAPGANARLFLDPGSGEAVFSASGLPALSAQRTYQLWFLTGAGQPVSAGVFEVGPGGRAGLLVDAVPPQGIAAWAVTLEPAGGVPQPTGPMVLKS